MMKMKTLQLAVAPLVLLASLSRGDSASPLDFEAAPLGPMTEIETPVGAFRADVGHAEITNHTARSGKRALRIHGGEDHIVELTPAASETDDLQLAFWAERWTRRTPFVFTVDRLTDGQWRQVYDGSKTVRLGGFHEHVRIDLSGKQVQRIRFRCTAPTGGGVLMDDVRLGPRRPMRVTRVAARQPSTPLLVGGVGDPLLEIAIETEGEKNAPAVRAVRVRADGGAASHLASVAVAPAPGAGDQPTAGKPSADAAAGGEAAQALAAGHAVRLAVNQTLQSGRHVITVNAKLKATADLDQVIRAQCLAIEWADGSVTELGANGADGADDATASPPQRLGVALRNAGDDGVKVYRIPGLVTTNRGTLIAVYDIRHTGGRDLPGHIDVGMSRSTDSGRSWEDMKTIIDMGSSPKHLGDGVGDPAILVDRQTGAIWVAGLWSHGNRGWHGSGPGLTPQQTGQLVLVRSDDDGITWSDPINITAQVKDPAWRLLLQGPGAGITMQDGTLVFAAQFRDAQGLPHSTILYSKDRGERWHIGAAAFPDTTEAQVVELTPGVLMLNCRYNRQNRRVVVISNDMGKTWSEHPTSRSALPEPGACMASLIRVQRGTPGQWLAFSNPYAEGPPRRNLMIQLSPDNGKTWPKQHQMLLDEGVSAGYSCLTQIDKNTLGILYEGSRSHLTFQRIRIGQPQPKKQADGARPGPD